MKTLSTTDNLTLLADRALRTIFGKPLTTDRANPANTVAEADLTRYEKDEAGRLMRVNHVGEVCAQALYQGQALTAKDQRVQEKLKQASAEENDHLVWCEQRLGELDSRKSLLNPLWYAGSFCIGATAGLLGDKWSLGFLAETEKQVVEHLDDHLKRLPETDEKSRAIVEQMKIDEGEHATTAIRAGGVPLPEPVRKLMKLSSKVMTGTAHWI